MNVSFDNRILSDISTELAHIDVESVAPGTNVSVVLDSNDGISQNTYVILGDLLFPKTEIALVNAAVVPGTDIQVDSLLFPHYQNETIRTVEYNKVRLYSSATENGVKILESEKEIDIEQRYTDFIVSDDSVGYFYFALYNEQSDTESDMSAGILATDTSNKSRSAIRSFIETFYDDDLSDTRLQILMDSVIDTIFAIRAWKFREAKTTFQFTAGTFEYDIEDDLGISDYGKLVSARTDTQMLKVVDSDLDDILSLTPLVLMPHVIFEWAGKLHIRIPSSETVTIKYLKNTEKIITSGQKTSVSLVNAIGFGILELLYMTKDRSLAKDFGAKFAFAIKAMRKDDDKDIEIGSLHEANVRQNSETTPNIISE